MAQTQPYRTAGLGRPLPQVYITMHRKLRDFIADQDRIVAIKSDWLYKLCGPAGRSKMIAAAGFTPVSSPELAPATTRPTSPRRTTTAEARA